MASERVVQERQTAARRLLSLRRRCRGKRNCQANERYASDNPENAHREAPVAGLNESSRERDVNRRRKRAPKREHTDRASWCSRRVADSQRLSHVVEGKGT